MSFARKPASSSSLSSSAERTLTDIKLGFEEESLHHIERVDVHKSSTFAGLKQLVRDLYGIGPTQKFDLIRNGSTLHCKHDAKVTEFLQPGDSLSIRFVGKRFWRRFVGLGRDKTQASIIPAQQDGPSQHRRQASLHSVAESSECVTQDGESWSHITDDPSLYKIVWEVLLEDGYGRFSEDLQPKVEAAYRKFIAATKVEIQTRQWPYEVDIIKMTQVNLRHKNHKVRKVQRLQGGTWEFDSDKGWVPYKPEDAIRFEEAWEDCQKNAKLQYDIQTGSQTWRYELDLMNMTQTNLINNKQRKVQRTPVPLAPESEEEEEEEEGHNEHNKKVMSFPVPPGRASWSDNPREPLHASLPLCHVVPPSPPDSEEMKTFAEPVVAVQFGQQIELPCAALSTTQYHQPTSTGGDRGLHEDFSVVNGTGSSSYKCDVSVSNVSHTSDNHAISDSTDKLPVHVRVSSFVHQRSPNADSEPKWFEDPFTYELLADPVIAGDTYTYERESIERTFARQREQSARAGVSDPVVTSPLTNEVIPDTLIPNRAIEDMVVKMVKDGSLPIPGHELQEWHMRRARKLVNDEKRKVAELDRDARRIRLDRQGADTQFGLNDSGFSIFLPKSRRGSGQYIDQKHCSVNFCFAPVDQNSKMCARCLRHVCEECRKVEVSDIRTDDGFEPTHHVCVECVAHIADILATLDPEERAAARMSDTSKCLSVREELLRKHVGSRLTAITEEALAHEEIKLRHDVISTSCCIQVADEISSMKKRIEETDTRLSFRLRAFKKSFEDAVLQDSCLPERAQCLQFLKDQLQSLSENELEIPLDAEEVLSLPATETLDIRVGLESGHPKNVPLPINLQYPPTAVQEGLKTLKQRLDALVQVKRPMMMFEVRQREIGMKKIRGEYERSVLQRKEREEIITELATSLDLLSEAGAQMEAQSALFEISVAAISERLVRHPSDGDR